MGSILIQNGRIWDGTQFFMGDILTEDGVIAQIAPGISEKASFAYDAAGKIVSAGLVDIHMHMHGLSIPQYGICAEAVCFPFGVTAAADAGSRLGDRDTMITLKHVVFADTKIENDHLNIPVTQERLSRYGDSAVGLKLFFASPNVTDITPLREVCDFAGGKKVMVHCNHSPVSMAQIVEMLRPGDILSHVYHGGAHNCLESEAFQLAKEKGVVMDTAFAGHVHTDFAVLKRAIAAGMLPDTVSTDITKSSAFTRGGRYGLTMCMSMAKTAGMTEEDIFRAVTTAPAEALGMDWGRLQVGKAADIAVLELADEGFSLADHAGNVLQSSTGYRCCLTISNGQVVYKH